ncbi:MAG: hypothetical protein IIA54_01965 [Chloroflexi bacterium]|nr:hypothetical protein [Chloroflexota bacterium]
MASIAAATGSYEAATRTADMTGMQRMARKMWAPWAVMGLMIVGIALILGVVLQAKVGFIFEFDKLTRDGDTGAILDARQFVETTKAWLPTFKFLGLGMLLGSIIFLLATVLGNLRAGGAAVQRSLGADVKAFKPAIANVFPMLMMMGVMVLVAAFVVGIVNATTANDLFSHSIAEIDSAAAGSELLRQLGTVNAVAIWLAPFKFVGMALLFSGIAVALLTIVRVLRWQTGRLVDIAGGR